MSYKFFQCLYMRTHANLHCGLLLQPAWHAWLGSPLRCGQCFRLGTLPPNHLAPLASTVFYNKPGGCIMFVVWASVEPTHPAQAPSNPYMHCTTSMQIRARWTQPTKLLLVCVCVRLGKRWQALQTCGRSLAPIITLSSCCKDFHVGFELCVCVCVGII